MPKPNTSAATLRRILQQELLIGKRLLELAEEQSDAIIAGDVARLSALELTQRRCVEQQEQLETARIRATRDLALPAAA